MLQINTFRKNFYLWNLLGLLPVSLLLKSYHPATHWIEWPLSYLLSIYVIALLHFSTFTLLKKWYFYLISCIFFSLLHLLLSGLFEIVLTRFFRLEESYTLGTFSYFILDHNTFLLDGAIWWFLYTIIFSWIRSLSKITAIEYASSLLDKKLTKSDIRTLSKEINPHFVFNAMNSIAMKVRLKENKVAVDMIASLNILLRRALRNEKEELILLKDELLLLQQYLLIEKSRFGDQISVAIDCEEACKGYKVPQLILQPLAENAFKHGMDHDIENMKLDIIIFEKEEAFSILVHNTDEGKTKINYANSNVGLPNIAHRLKNHYGNKFQFQSFTTEDGIAFKIVIPKEL